MTDIPLVQMLISVAVFAASAALAWFLTGALVRLAIGHARRTRTTLDDALIAAARWPLFALMTAGGLYLSLVPLDFEPGLESQLLRGVTVAMALIGIWAGVTLVTAALRWYEKTAASGETSLTCRLVRYFRSGVFLVAAVGAAMVVLQVYSVEPLPLLGWVGDHGWRIVFIVAIAMIAILALGHVIPGIVAAGISRRAAESREDVNKRSRTLSRVLVNTSQVFVLLITLFMVLSELGIDIAPVLAGVGVLGVAIGFGAQTLIRDLLGGVFVVLENHYSVGDVVKVGGVAGLVEDINLRRTVLRDLDGVVHVVPNGEVRVASNMTKDWSRVNINVTVGYREDLSRVIAIINRVGSELARDPLWSPSIIKPPQVLRVDDWAASGIEIKIIGDTRPMRQWDVMGELRLRLKNTFDKEGIEIPWPHVKVFFGDSILPLSEVAKIR